MPSINVTAQVWFSSPPPLSFVVQVCVLVCSCSWLPPFLFPFFALKKALDQIFLKGAGSLLLHTLTQTASAVLYFMLLWKQYEYKASSTKQNLDTSAGKKESCSLLCVSSISCATLLTLLRCLEGYFQDMLAMRICLQLSSKLKFRKYLGVSGHFQSTLPVVFLVPPLLSKCT